MEAKKYGELDIWIREERVPRFMDEFTDLNDAKFDESDLIDEKDGDVRIALSYRLFNDGETKYPFQTYYQLNNDFIQEVDEQ